MPENNKAQERHIINVADWRTNPQDLIDKVNQFLGDHSSGCIVVTLEGPMRADEV